MPSSKKQTEELKMFEVTYEEEVPLQITLDMGATKLDKPPKQKKKKKSQIDTPLAPYRPEPEGLQTFSFPEKGHGGKIRNRGGGYDKYDDYDDFDDNQTVSSIIGFANEKTSGSTGGFRGSKGNRGNGGFDTDRLDSRRSPRPGGPSRAAGGVDDQTMLMTDILDTGRIRDRDFNGGNTAPVYRRTRLAAPIQRGGDAAFHMVQSFLRNLSAILILASIAVIVWHFWRSSTPYGDVTQALETLSVPIALAAYALVGAMLVLYELVALLWTMSKPRFHDEYGSYRADVGRGGTSFILLYLCSYACFLIHDHIPEINELFRGIRGAMEVFGAQHNVLLGLCAAGVISCLIRKYSSSLQKF